MRARHLASWSAVLALAASMTACGLFEDEVVEQEPAKRADTAAAPDTAHAVDKRAQEDTPDDEAPPEAANPFAWMPPESERVVRRDAEGAALPPGAVERLGSTLLRHEDRILDLLVTPDGSSVISAGLDGAVRFWDIQDGARLRPPLVHPAGVHAVDVPQTTLDRVVTAADDGLLRVWALPRGEISLSVNPGLGPLDAVAVEPSGQLVAVAGPDSSRVIVYASDTGDVKHTLAGLKGGVESLAFSEDGAALAALDARGRLAVWDMPAGTERFHVDGLVTGGRHRAEFSRNGDVIAVSGDTVVLIDARTGEDILSLPGDRPQQVSDVAFSADDRRVFATHGGDILVWDAQTGAPVGPPLPLPGNGLSTALALGGNPPRLAVAREQAVLLLDPDADTVVVAPQGHNEPISGLAWAPADGNGVLATAGLDGTVLLWNLAQGTPSIHLDHPHPIGDVAIAPNGRIVLTTQPLGTPRLWFALDAARPGMKPIGNLGPRGREPSIRRVVLVAGPRAALGDDRGHVHLVSLTQGTNGPETSRSQPPIEVGDAPVTALATSRDGLLLATGLADGTLRIDPLRPTPGDEATDDTGGDAEGTGDEDSSARPSPIVVDDIVGRIQSLAFHPERAWLAVLIDASVAPGASIALYDTASGEVIDERIVPSARCMGVAPDGGLIAIGRDDGVVTLLEAQPLRTRMDLYGHHLSVEDLVFARGGERLVSASRDTTALVWDLEPLRDYIAPFESAVSAAPSREADRSERTGQEHADGSGEGQDEPLGSAGGATTESGPDTPETTDATSGPEADASSTTTDVANPDARPAQPTPAPEE